MVYRYYIVYQEYRDGVPIGIGNGEVTLANKIKSREDIANITKTILENSKEIDYAIVLNYILMEEIGYENEKNEEAGEVASESL